MGDPWVSNPCGAQGQVMQRQASQRREVSVSHGGSCRAGGTDRKGTGGAVELVMMATWHALTKCSAAAHRSHWQAVPLGSPPDMLSQVSAEQPCSMAMPPAKVLPARSSSRRLPAAPDTSCKSRRSPKGGRGAAPARCSSSKSGRLALQLSVAAGVCVCGGGGESRGCVSASQSHVLKQWLLLLCSAAPHPVSSQIWACKAPSPSASASLAPPSRQCPMRRWRRAGSTGGACTFREVGVGGSGLTVDGGGDGCGQ